MGAGPRRLLEGGAAQRLQRDGFQVDVAFAEPESSFTTEIGTAFELHRRVATLVGQAIVEGSFPVILSGNCNTAAIGALGAIGAMQPSIVWLDGHADFCTPETAELGFLDGMGLPMATGRCWTSLTGAVPGFRPVPDDRVVLVGAHEIEA
jgi:arginase